MARKEQGPQAQGNAPSHGVFVVEGEGDSAFWTRIGSAWPHRDGQGFNLSLTAMPLTGRLVARANREGGQ